jgi:signal transduction histidine kinase
MRQLVTAKSEEEAYQATAVVLDCLTAADRCLVALDEEGSFVTGATVPTGLVEVLDSPRITDETGILRHAFKIGKPFRIDDLTDVRSTSNASGSADAMSGYRSLLCVPVGEVGILVAAARQRAAFSESDLESVKLLGSIVSAAIEQMDSPSSSTSSGRLEEVATVLSHDATNHLSIATGYLDLAREDPRSENLDRVEVALTRLEELIDDTVTLIRTGDRITSLEEVEIVTIAEQAWKTAVNAGESELTVSSSATILADRSSVCRLLENLFRNAVEHGGSTVSVHVGLLADTTGFYVEDDGGGIPDGAREDIFDCGYSSADDQTGFGLSIVQWIVDAHGWHVTVRDGERGGARFEIAGVEMAD